MKNKLYYLFLVFMVVAASCKKTEQTPFVLPEGNFIGTFTRIHYNIRTAKLDTATANLIVKLSAATGFSVTGDTTKYHAGSHGSYIANPYNMQFLDQTLVPNTPLYPGKEHLAGIYNYSLSDGNLKIAANNDTIGVYYNLQQQ